MSKKDFLDYAGLKRVLKKSLWRGTKAELTAALAAGEIPNGTTIQVTDDYDDPGDPDVTVTELSESARIVEDSDVLAIDSTQTKDDWTAFYRAQFLKNYAGVELYKYADSTFTRIWSTESTYYNGVDTLEQLVTDSKIAVNACSRKWYRFRNCTNNPTGGTSTDDNDYFVMAQFIEKNDTQQWICAIAYDIRSQAIYTNSRFGTDTWSGWKAIFYAERFLPCTTMVNNNLGPLVPDGNIQIGSNTGRCVILNYDGNLYYFNGGTSVNVTHLAANTSGTGTIVTTSGVGTVTGNVRWVKRGNICSVIIDNLYIPTGSAGVVGSTILATGLPFPALRTFVSCPNQTTGTAAFLCIDSGNLMIDWGMNTDGAKTFTSCTYVCTDDDAY